MRLTAIIVTALTLLNFTDSATVSNTGIANNKDISNVEHRPLLVVKRKFTRRAPTKSSARGVANITGSRLKARSGEILDKIPIVGSLSSQFNGVGNGSGGENRDQSSGEATADDEGESHTGAR